MTSQSTIIRGSTLMLILASTVTLAMLTYGFFQFRFMQAQRRAVAENKMTAVTMADELNSSKKSYDELSKAYSAVHEALAKKIASILPTDERYTDLTRQLDEYFVVNDKDGNPIFQSSLRFGKGAPVAQFPGISALPVSMNIEATRENFFKFLEFISSSGSLDTGIRLMAIKGVQLNFPDGGELLKNPRQDLNFTVEMSAYYVTPKVARQ